VKVKDTTTVELLISVGKVGNDPNYNKFSYKTNIKLEDGSTSVFPLYNVIWDYQEDMIKDAYTTRLTDNEFQRYKYKPKLLAADLYGNPEVYYIILILNDMMEEGEFDSKIIKLLSRSDMQKYLTSIYNSEYMNLTKHGFIK
jgi:hypothetical protein